MKSFETRFDEIVSTLPELESGILALPFAIGDDLGGSPPIPSVKDIYEQVLRTPSGAVLCGPYRFALWRGTSEQFVLYVGLNPSTADADLDDPTIRVLRGYNTRAFGGASVVVVNVCPFRATDPSHLGEVAPHIPDDVWSTNAETVEKLAQSAVAVVACWGAGVSRVAPRLKPIVDGMRASGRRVMCFGTTKGGYPWHPLRKKLGDLIALDQVVETR